MAVLCTGKVTAGLEESNITAGLITTVTNLCFAQWQYYIALHYIALHYHLLNKGQYLMQLWQKLRGLLFYWAAAYKWRMTIIYGTSAMLDDPVSAASEDT